MKKTIYTLVLACILFIPNAFFAQTTYTAVEYGGYWHDPETWSPAGVPGPGDYVVVIDQLVIITGQHEIAGFTLDWGTFAGTIKFDGGGNPSLTVTGNSIWGAGIFDGGNGIEGNDGVNNTLLFTETSVVTMTDNPGGHNFHYLDFGTHMVNKGTIILQGNSFVGGRGFSTLHNEALIDIQGDGGFDGATFSGATFINTGTLRKSGGTGISTFTGWWTFENQDGIIEAQSGTLTYAGGGSFNGGTYYVSENAVLSLSGLTYIFSGTLSGSPEGVFSLNGNSAIISTDSANVTFNIKGTGFQFVTGTINGGGTLIIPEGALLVLPGTDYALLKGGTTLLNQGTVKHFGTNAFGIQGYSIVENQSLWEISSDAGFSGYTSTGRTFNNTGIFRKSGGDAITSINGFLDFQNLNGGIIDIETGTLEFTSSINFENAPGGIIQGVGTINVPSNFTNNGITSPGDSPGTLSYIGNFQPSETAVLKIDLGGLEAGTEHDQLAVTGAATLNGSIDVSLVNGYIPTKGDTYVVLTSTGATSNEFVNVTATPELFISVQVNPNDVTIVVDSVGNISAVGEGLAVAGFELNQNYPNPFYSNTKIKFEIIDNAANQGQPVSLKVYDLSGKEVANLMNRELSPGTYEVNFDGSFLPGGIYFCKLMQGNFLSTKKMVLMK